MKSITFENEIQAAVFQLELKGQISDGHWENDPQSNYKTWCSAEVKVGDNVGRDFYVSKNLGFSSKFLFECVGDRMLHYARLVIVSRKLFGEQLPLTEILSIVAQLERILTGEEKPHFGSFPNWWSNEYKQAFYDLNIDRVKALTIACEVWKNYNYDDVRKELKNISKITKIHNY